MKPGDKYIERTYINGELTGELKLSFSHTGENGTLIFDQPDKHNSRSHIAPECYPVHQWEINPGVIMKTVVTKNI